MAKAKKAKSTGTGRVLKIDGKDLQGEGSVRLPEADYRAKIAAIKQSETKDDARSMLVLTYKITDGKYKGKKIIDRIVLVGNDEKKSTIWKLRQILEAMGKEVPTKMFNLNIDKLIGPEVAITVVDGNPYNNRIKSEIGDVNSVEILDDAAEDEDDDDDDDTEDEDMEDVDLDDEL